MDKVVDEEERKGERDSDPGSVIKLCMQTANEAKVKVCFLFSSSYFWSCVMRESKYMYIRWMAESAVCINVTHLVVVLWYNAHYAQTKRVILIAAAAATLNLSERLHLKANIQS